MSTNILNTLWRYNINAQSENITVPIIIPAIRTLPLLNEDTISAAPAIPRPAYIQQS